MKAIQITEFGGPDVMELVELDTLITSEGQELIEVSAIGINYADTHQTENSYLSPTTITTCSGN
jgi:NADPH2:quinone reductase